MSFLKEYLKDADKKYVFFYVIRLLTCHHNYENFTFYDRKDLCTISE